MFLSFQMVFSLASAAIVWAVLESTSLLEPSSQIVAPMYLKWSTVSIVCPCIVMYLCKVPLFVIILVFSTYRHAGGPLELLFGSIQCAMRRSCNQSCYNGDGSEVPREVVLQFLVDEEACSCSPIISFALQSSVGVHMLWRRLSVLALFHVLPFQFPIDYGTCFPRVLLFPLQVHILEMFINLKFCLPVYPVRTSSRVSE